jgi:hypothetical protein
MNLPHRHQERRFAQRLELRLSIVVSGRNDDGTAWSEPTDTDDISTNGALLHLNQKVNEGEGVFIRSNRPDGVPVEVKSEGYADGADNLRSGLRRRRHYRSDRKLAETFRGMDCRQRAGK